MISNKQYLAPKKLSLGYSLPFEKKEFPRDNRSDSIFMSFIDFKLATMMMIIIIIVTTTTIKT